MTSPVADNLPFPSTPARRFSLAQIDCPWHYETRSPVTNKETDRSPQRHYPTASIDHLKTIPMQDILEPDAWVACWITGPLMVRGVHVILARAWGLKLSSMGFVWIKLWNGFDTGALARTPLLEQDIAMGGGYTTRQNAEFCVFMRNGEARRSRADIRQVIVSPRREHSRKPEEGYRRLEHFATGEKIDMFGGLERPGWEYWGWPHWSGDRVHERTA